MELEGEVHIVLLQKEKGFQLGNDFCGQLAVRNMLYNPQIFKIGFYFEMILCLQKCGRDIRESHTVLPA